MTEAELIILVTSEIKGLSSNLVADDYSNAISDAQKDTGFALPVTDDFRIKWLKERTKRHLFFYLWTESATSFKFKQINLQQKFDHFDRIIEKMDKDFETAQKENTYEFAQVEPTQLFGHKVDAGFAYNSRGKDITYDENQLVMITPSDKD